LKEAELALGEEAERSQSGMDAGCEGTNGGSGGTEALMKALGELSGRFQGALIKKMTGGPGRNR